PQLDEAAQPGEPARRRERGDDHGVGELGRGSLEDRELKGLLRAEVREQPALRHARAASERADRQPFDARAHGLLDGPLEARLARPLPLRRRSHPPKIARPYFSPTPKPAPPQPLPIPTRSPLPSHPLPIPAELGTWHRDRHAPLPTWVPGAEVSARGRAGEGAAGQAVARALSKAARRGSLNRTKRTREGRGAPSSAGSDCSAHARTAPTATLATSPAAHPNTPALTAGKATERAPRPEATSRLRVKHEASSAGSVCPRRASGPTVWITQRAGRRPAPVATASPAGSPSGRVDARNARHSSRSAGPAAAWIAPSTPPPPSSDELAALPIASTCSRVMSPSAVSTWTPEISTSVIGPACRTHPLGAGHRARRARRQEPMRGNGSVENTTSTGTSKYSA